MGEQTKQGGGNFASDNENEKITRDLLNGLLKNSLERFGDDIVIDDGVVDVMVPFEYQLQGVFAQSGHQYTLIKFCGALDDERAGALCLTDRPVYQCDSPDREVSVVAFPDGSVKQYQSCESFDNFDEKSFEAVNSVPRSVYLDDMHKDTYHEAPLASADILKHICGEDGEDLFNRDICMEDIKKYRLSAKNEAQDIIEAELVSVEDVPSNSTPQLPPASTINRSNKLTQAIRRLFGTAE